MGIRMMITATDYKYPLQVLYFCLSRGIVAVKFDKGKDKAIPLQAWTGPEGPRSLRLPDFKTIGTSRWQVCQPYAQATFNPRNFSWYSFLLNAESTPGP
jgi:hypothetical protein